MKKNLLLAISFPILVMCSWADGWTDPDTGYTWFYTIKDNGATIYRNNLHAVSPWPTGEIAVPDMLGGKPVKAIGTGAFQGCHGLTKVTLPDSVTSIGVYAFYKCTSLTNVVFSMSLKELGLDAFEDCISLESATCRSWSGRMAT